MRYYRAQRRGWAGSVRYERPADKVSTGGRLEGGSVPFPPSEAYAMMDLGS